MTDQTLKWSETSIKTMGLAQGTALDAASTYADMGTSMGQTTAEAYNMSTSLTQLAADMSSFKNIAFDRTQLALTAVYTGETEAMKSLGIVMTEDNLKAYALSQGMSKLYKDMSQAERVTLRYQYVMAMTANAQGDFVRTGGNTANQSRKLIESTKQLGESFGNLLLPAVNGAIGGLQDAVNWLISLDDSAKSAVLTVGAITAAIGPLLLMLSKAPLAIKGIKEALMWFKGSPVAIGITAAAAAITALVALLKANKREVDKNSDSYKRLKQIVEGGIDGKVEVDDKELEGVINPETPYTVTITGDPQGAIDAASSIAGKIANGDYNGVITINGQEGDATGKAKELQDAINGLGAAIKINADGTAVISGDVPAGALKTLLDKINALPAEFTVTANDGEATAQIEALRQAAASIVGSVVITTYGGETAKSKIDKMLEKLNTLPSHKDVELEFQTIGRTAAEIQEYAEAITAAASATTGFDDAVKNLDSLTDKKLAENEAALNKRVSERGQALGRAVNSGAITEEEYNAEIEKLNTESQSELIKLRSDADAEKKQHALFNDGSRQNDAAALAQLYKELPSTEGGVTSEDFAFSRARLKAAYEQGGDMDAIDAKIVNAGLIKQATDAYNGLTAATEEYNAAQTKTNDTEKTAVEENEQKIKDYGALQQATDIYAANIEGDNSEESRNAALESAMYGRSESQQEMIRDALTKKDENGNDSPISYAETFDVSDNAAARQAELEGEITQIQSDAQAEREKSKAAYTEKITALQNEMNAEELSGIMELTAQAGVIMDKGNQQMVLGVTAAVEGMAKALADGGTEVVGEVAKIADGIGKQASKAKSEGKSVGKAIVEGILAGLSDNGAIARKIAQMVQSAIANAGVGGSGGGGGGGGEPTANGRFVTKATQILAGEDGDEVIIPLSQKHKFRGLELWREAGKRLGIIGAIKSGTEGIISGGDPVGGKTGRSIYQTAADGTARSSILDYERLEAVLSRRPAKFYLNSREFALATAGDNNTAIGARKSLISRGRGGRT